MVNRCNKAEEINGINKLTLWSPLRLQHWEPRLTTHKVNRETGYKQTRRNRDSAWRTERDRIKSSRKDRREVTDVSPTFKRKRAPSALRGTLPLYQRGNLSHPSDRTRHGLTHPQRPQDRSHPVKWRLHLPSLLVCLVRPSLTTQMDGICCRVANGMDSSSFTRHCLTRQCRRDDGLRNCVEQKTIRKSLGTSTFLWTASIFISP